MINRVIMAPHCTTNGKEAHIISPTNWSRWRLRLFALNPSALSIFAPKIYTNVVYTHNRLLFVIDVHKQSIANMINLTDNAIWSAWNRRTEIRNKHICTESKWLAQIYVYICVVVCVWCMYVYIYIYICRYVYIYICVIYIKRDIHTCIQRHRQRDGDA